MKSKILNGLLLFSSLMVYMEWSNQHRIMFQAEAEVLHALLFAPKSVLHPLTLLPLLGQLLLIFTLIQKTPGKGLTYFSIFALGILIVLVFVAGVLRLNLIQTLSTLPFFVVSVLIVIRFRRQKKLQSEAAYESERRD